jgi:hypothetical protein
MIEQVKIDFKETRLNYVLKAAENTIMYEPPFENKAQAINADKNWSRDYSYCIKCSSSKEKHVSRGLCRVCYQKVSALKNNNYKRQKRGVVDDILTKEKLYNLYFVKAYSFGEISKMFGTSRSNISVKFKKYGLQTRSLSDSRKIALDKGKFKGKELRKWNESFFDNWSNEMAYCLGLLFTDGCIVKSGVTFTQKDIELVQKFSSHIKLQNKLYFRQEKMIGGVKSGECYVLQLNSVALVERLSEFGLEPKKSLTMKFPAMPNKYVRHFIRGCWDGDGSIYFDNYANRYNSKYVSGSFDFVSTLMQHLMIAGLPKKNIYKTTNANAYTIQYGSKAELKTLYRYLYDGVNESCYLKRKYDLFTNAINI